MVIVTQSVQPVCEAVSVTQTIVVIVIHEIGEV